MDDTIEFRVSRIYSAIGAVQESDLAKLESGVDLRVEDSEAIVTVTQDFRGGLTPEEISNYADSLIDNVAYLRDHLIKWAEKNGKPKNRVDETINNSRSLLILRDLANNNKHGYPPKNEKGYSGLAPRLINVDKVLQLAPNAKSGSIVWTLGADGSTKLSEDDSVVVVITGKVVDKDDNHIGDLYPMVVQAVEDWEALLGEFGIG